jgi:hypothetical protein
MTMVKVNGVVFSAGTAPTGESLYEAVPVGNGTDVVEVAFEGAGDIADMIFAKRYIDRSTHIYTACVLRLSRLPYGDAASEWLDIMVSLIDSLHFSEVFLPKGDYPGAVGEIDNLRYE